MWIRNKSNAIFVKTAQNPARKNGLTILFVSGKPCKRTTLEPRGGKHPPHMVCPKNVAVASHESRLPKRCSCSVERVKSIRIRMKTTTFRVPYFETVQTHVLYFSPSRRGFSHMRYERPLVQNTPKAPSSAETLG